MTPEQLLERLGGQALDNREISDRLAAGPHQTAAMTGAPQGNNVLANLINNLPTARALSTATPSAQHILPEIQIGPKGLGQP